MENTGLKRIELIIPLLEMQFAESRNEAVRIAIQSMLSVFYKKLNAFKKGKYIVESKMNFDEKSEVGRPEAKPRQSTHDKGQ